MGSIKSFFTRSLWGQTLILLISWNIIVRILAVLAYFILPARYAPPDFIAPFFQSNFLWWGFANFDGEHYLSIAKYGYQFRGGFPQYAFFPLLPTAIAGLSKFMREYYLSGMIISQASLWVALVYLSKWARLLKLSELRPLLLFTSGSIFLASIYTEPVFIMLATMTMYFSERKWWGRAVLATALSTATRVNGLLLSVFLAVKIYRHTKSIPQVLSYGVASLSGLIAYMTYLFVTTGQAFSWFSSQGAWGKSTATSPFTTALSYLRAVSVDFRPDLVHFVVVIEVLTTLVACYLLYRLVRSRLLDFSYWLYLALNLAMPIATGSLGSMPRFFLILFPLLAVVPTLPKLGKTLYYSFSLLTFLVGTILFIRGYWYA